MALIKYLRVAEVSLNRFSTTIEIELYCCYENLRYISQSSTSGRGGAGLLLSCIPSGLVRVEGEVAMTIPRTMDSWELKKALVGFCGQSAEYEVHQRLRHVVVTSNTNPAAIAVIVCSLDPYPSDRPRVNYVVTRNLVDVDAYEHGVIDYQTLIVRQEIKWGETRDFNQRQHSYVKCQYMYRHESKAFYTTPERKLTEHLMQDNTHFARRLRTVCSCRKRHTEWVDYLSAGGEQGLENLFI
ncbi:hypothetical protein B0H14DRAFT_2590812 [Mycena olivaceomarginata]|nr:hypothetical protein B0H14DRAFT_2590812 [Mycena olivaceomarginata]